MRGSRFGRAWFCVALAAGCGRELLFSAEGEGEDAGRIADVGPSADVSTDPGPGLIELDTGVTDAPQDSACPALPVRAGDACATEGVHCFASVGAYPACFQHRTGPP